MNSVSRRAFLQTTAASLALLAGGGVSFFNPLHSAWAADKPEGKELWLICDTSIYVNKSFMETHRIMMTNPGSVNGFDVQSGLAFSIDTPFFGHSITQNPAQPNQIVTFEQWGRRGALLDLKEKKLISPIEPDMEHLFFGHAVFLSDGSHFITSEDNYDHKNGQLIVRDSSSLRAVGQMPSYGTMPHECIMIDNGRTIIVANEGLYPSTNNSHASCSNVAWVETASGKLLHQVFIEGEPHAAYNHLAMSSDGWLCVIGFTSPEKTAGSGRIRLISPEGKVIEPEIPGDVAAHLTGQVLSAAFLGDSGLVAATAPHSDKVIILDYRKQKFVDAIDVPKARGILSDISLPASACGMIVSNGKDKNVEDIVMPSSGAPPTVSVDKRTFGGNGSHLIRAYV